MIAPHPRRFALGQIVATPNALARIPVDAVLAAFNRHRVCDWGDVCAEDFAANELALIEGTRLFSVFHTSGGVKFWIITEADRSVTTVLLPEDY
jgi:hypothetical protein